MGDARGDFYSFLGGVLFGAVIGGVLGILYAPKAGEETRKDIKEKAGEVYEKSKDIYAEQRERIGQAVETGKEAITAKSGELREKLEETAAKIKETVETPKPAQAGKPAAEGKSTKK